ncbi:MAG: PPE family protein [Gemmatimonadales bacterium]
MSFALWPPEINSGLLYSGPGSGPMLAAGAAWDSLATDLYSTATSYQSVIANLTGGPWLGPSSSSLATAAAPYVAWLHATAGQAEQVGAHAKATAGAYETAHGAIVPPPVIAANRALLAALVATNFLGQNTGAIAVAEMHYLEMWLQDGLVMDTYAAAVQHLMALPQHTLPPSVSTGAPVAQAAAMTQSAATNTAAASPLDLLGGLGGLPSLPTSLTGLPTLLSGALSGFPGGEAGAVQAITLGSVPARFAMYPMQMLMQMARMGQTGATGAANGSQSLLNTIGQFVDGKLQAVVGGVSNQLRTWGSAVTAQLGQAHSLGGLSVPNAWHSAAPAMSRAAPVLPGTSVNAPALASGMQNSPFAQALMGGLSGRGIGGLAGKVPAKLIPRSPAGG